MTTRFPKSFILTSLTLGLIYFLICNNRSNLFQDLTETVASRSQSEDNGTSETPNSGHFDPTVRQAFLKSQIAAAEEAYQRYVTKRRALVKDPAMVNPWPPQWVMYFWDYFLPAFTCPHMTERIGTLGDGGKWVCGFHLYDKASPKGSTDLLTTENKRSRPCVVYSFGVAYESSFEAEILRRTNCRIYAYDASVNRMGPQVPRNNPRVKFNKLFVGAENTNTSITLKSLMQLNGHVWIDFLKVDIEGAELTVLDKVMRDFEILPFGQLQIEFHTDEMGSNFPKVYELWEQMEEKGLRAFKNEVNHWPCVRVRKKPMYVEYSFINLRGNHRLIR